MVDSWIRLPSWHRKTAAHIHLHRAAHDEIGYPAVSGLVMADGNVLATRPPLHIRAWQGVESDSQINFFFVGSPSQCAAMML
jgi:hypothetical protein